MSLLAQHSGCFEPTLYDLLTSPTSGLAITCTVLSISRSAVVPPLPTYDFFTDFHRFTLSDFVIALLTPPVCGSIQLFAHMGATSELLGCLFYHCPLRAAAGAV